ncbi:MAG TPA: 16S rRNA (cytidine(1402)-2'-O)-methyltransferase [Micromonosporaceae bacterium]|nr:16S rRNA (cytidine(1402)-2'-O)-methyltransferase [Micromonosporaceae bacterium]
MGTDQHDKHRRGCLILLGAPLGNAADGSDRLRDVLATADLIAAEDTRRLRRLARDLGVVIAGRVVSYFEGNESGRTPELIQAARDGAIVAVVTDGGMPSVSDPGFRAVRAALDAGVAVSTVPGPSAVTTALAVSGLPCDRFCFEGFLPRRSGERRSRIAALATEERTLVFFEAPHRIASSLVDLATAFGPDRPAALCRELTKLYEEVRRDTLGALADWTRADPPRGEITLVVAGAPTAMARPSDVELRSAIANLHASGTSRRDAITEVARQYGLSRRDVYAVAVSEAGREESDGDE